MNIFLFFFKWVNYELKCKSNSRCIFLFFIIFSSNFKDNSGFGGEVDMCVLKSGCVDCVSGLGIIINVYKGELDWGGVCGGS